MRLESYFASMNGTMAFSAKTCEIVGRVIQFVAVNVMNVKIYPPPLALFATGLTSPIIVILRALTKCFPVVGIVPLSNTALPGWIVGTTNRTAEGKRLSLSANRNTEPYQKLLDGGFIYAKLRSYIVNSPKFLAVLVIQPISLFVQRIFAIVTINVNVPTVLALVPGDKRTTAALAKGLLTYRKVLDWLASFTVCMGFLITPHLYTVANKNVLHSRVRNAKHGGYRSNTRPGSVITGHCVEFNDFLLDVFGNSLHISPVGGSE